MQRVVIIGRGASGKSALAVELAEITGLPAIELDVEFTAERVSTSSYVWPAVRARRNLHRERPPRHGADRRSHGETMPAREVDPMPRFRTRLTLLAAASVVPGLAQAQASSFGSGKAVGVTVQAVTRFEGFADPLAVGLHFTLIRASGPDFDFEIATLPTFIAGGALFLAPDVGIGHTFPIGSGALMLKAGPSAVLLATGMGSGAWWGLHGGAIAFLRLARNFGIRVEVVPRVYSVDGEQLSGATFGIGLTSLPTPVR